MTAIPDLSEENDADSEQRHQTSPEDEIERPQRDRVQTPLSTTRTCNKLRDVRMWTREVLMDLDRGALAKLDRKLLSGLSHDESWQAVRVPVSEAVWSSWRRYCGSAGISMGRAIQALIARELVRMLGRDASDDSYLLAQRVEDELAAREANVAGREREVGATEERLRTWNEQLRRWEGELEAREQRVALASKLMSRASAARAKVGRNERCSCGSGLKYKHCHGLSGR